MLASLGTFAIALQSSTPRSIVTYHRSVAPILAENCISCHRPNTAAPFSLIGYRNAKRWSAMIVSVTQSRRMPPWKPIGGPSLHGEMGLTVPEIHALRDWVDAGAPEGTPTDSPPPSEQKPWRLGVPSRIINLPREVEISAEGDDEFLTFPINLEFTAPEWVTAIDILPTTPSIVHHAIVYVRNRQRPPGEYRAVLGSWIPGITPPQFLTGTGVLVQPGDQLAVQIHYHKSGRFKKDRSKIGLYFSAEPVRNEIQHIFLTAPQFTVPASAPRHVEYVETTFPTAVTIHSLLPTLNLLGNRLTVTAEAPDGQTWLLLDLPDWDPNWQMQYVLKQPITLPAGTVMRAKAIYDNSENNLRNPNSPPRDIKSGTGAQDEVMNLAIGYSSARRNQ